MYFVNSCTHAFTHRHTNRIPNYNYITDRLIHNKITYTPSDNLAFLCQFDTFFPWSTRPSTRRCEERPSVGLVVEERGLPERGVRRRRLLPARRRRARRRRRRGTWVELYFTLDRHSQPVRYTYSKQ